MADAIVLLGPLPCSSGTTSSSSPQRRTPFVSSAPLGRSSRPHLPHHASPIARVVRWTEGVKVNRRRQHDRPQLGLLVHVLNHHWDCLKDLGRQIPKTVFVVFPYILGSLGSIFSRANIIMAYSKFGVRTLSLASGAPPFLTPVKAPFLLRLSMKAPLYSL